MHPDYHNHPGHADHDPDLDINFQPKHQMNTTETQSVTTLTGGESPKTESFLRLETLIKAEPDVFALIDLYERADGTFLYFIETPFASFPKFVIGRTDAENLAPQIIHKTATKWGAEIIWDETRI